MVSLKLTKKLTKTTQLEKKVKLLHGYIIYLISIQRLPKDSVTYKFLIFLKPYVVFLEDFVQRVIEKGIQEILA